MVHVDMVNHAIRFFDSIHGGRQSRADSFKALWKQLYAKVRGQAKSIECNWTLKFVDCPTQENYSDCGVFTIMFAIASIGEISFNKPIRQLMSCIEAMNMLQIRRLLAHLLLTTSPNIVPVFDLLGFQNIWTFKTVRDGLNPAEIALDVDFTAYVQQIKASSPGVLVPSETKSIDEPFQDHITDGENQSQTDDSLEAEDDAPVYRSVSRERSSVVLIQQKSKVIGNSLNLEAFRLDHSFHTLADAFGDPSDFMTPYKAIKILSESPIGSTFPDALTTDCELIGSNIVIDVDSILYAGTAIPILRSSPNNNECVQYYPFPARRAAIRQSNYMRYSFANAEGRTITMLLRQIPNMHVASFGPSSAFRLHLFFPRMVRKSDPENPRSMYVNVVDEAAMEIWYDELLKPEMSNVLRDDSLKHIASNYKSAATNARSKDGTFKHTPFLFKNSDFLDVIQRVRQRLDIPMPLENPMYKFGGFFIHVYAKNLKLCTKSEDAMVGITDFLDQYSTLSEYPNNVWIDVGFDVNPIDKDFSLVPNLRSAVRWVKAHAKKIREDIYCLQSDIGGFGASIFKRQSPLARFQPLFAQLYLIEKERSASHENGGLRRFTERDVSKRNKKFIDCMRDHLLALRTTPDSGFGFRFEIRISLAHQDEFVKYCWSDLLPSLVENVKFGAVSRDSINRLRRNQIFAYDSAHALLHSSGRSEDLIDMNHFFHWLLQANLSRPSDFWVDRKTLNSLGVQKKWIGLPLCDATIISNYYDAVPFLTMPRASDLSNQAMGEIRLDHLFEKRNNLGLVDAEDENKKQLIEVGREVEKIINHRESEDGVDEFYVSWIGYAATENSWIPRDAVNNGKLVRKYFKKQSKKLSKGRTSGDTSGFGIEQGPTLAEKEIPISSELKERADGIFERFLEETWETIPQGYRSQGDTSVTHTLNFDQLSNLRNFSLTTCSPDQWKEKFELFFTYKPDASENKGQGWHTKSYIQRLNDLTERDLRSVQKFLWPKFQQLDWVHKATEKRFSLSNAKGKVNGVATIHFYCRDCLTNDQKVAWEPLITRARKFRKKKRLSF